jgi:serine/threonine-protein kinase PknG
LNCTSTPGCPGTIVDGYCDHCGMAPKPAAVPVGAAQSAATPPIAAPTAGRTLGGPSSPSVPSARTGSQPILSSGTAPGSRSVRSTRTGTSSTSARRGMLGAGLVEVPRVPYRDPATAILDNPEVAENKRYCSNCGEPVGRSREGRPSRTEGFCPKCGTAFSFTPKLKPGDLVGGQYEVLGCLAHGGLGWIYLARDRNVSDRWVVLKGLLDTGDAEALAAAAAERAFLAEVEHPNIVKIYNFVQHPEPKTGVLVGYIVMEYVGGRSLKDVLMQYREKNGRTASLPLPQVLAYGLESLRALGYLHGAGLLYCDFKPDNVIQSEEQLKLLDLGGVRRIDDQISAIYGSVGYQAPEIAELGPSISSDLYTVGRTLAALSFPIRGLTSTYAHKLPERHEVPLLMRYESYDRLLRRACHEDPLERFQDAAEMAEQITGVLREVLSLDDGKPRPAPSTLYGPERYTAGADVAELAVPGRTPIGILEPPAAVQALPVPLVYGTDPAAGFLAGLTIREPEALAAALASAPVRSPEVGFMLARVRIELHDYAGAAGLLDDLEKDHAGDWRVDWYRALSALSALRIPDALTLFNGLYTWMPGEAAPKLGLAFSQELASRQGADRGAAEEAARTYDAVWRTDRSYVSAAFGLARVRLAVGDRGGAVAVLDSVPEISSRYVAAQVAAIAAAVRGRDPGDLAEPELAIAGQRLERLKLDPERHGMLAAEILETALGWVRSGRSASPGARLLGAPLTEDDLRRQLEKTYRGLARLAQPGPERLALVIKANGVRPRTLF